MLTPFGKLVRRLRIDEEMTLKQMAEALGVSPAFLTAVETGKKTAPADFPSRISAVVRKGAEFTKELTDAAALSKNVHKIVMGDRTTSRDREVAALFARQFTELTEEQKSKIKDILEQE